MINRDAKKETITVTNVSHELKKKRRKILCRWMEQRIARGIRIFLFEARSETRHLNVSKGPEDYIVSGSVSRWKENESWIVQFDPEAENSLLYSCRRKSADYTTRIFRSSDIFLFHRKFYFIYLSLNKNVSILVKFLISLMYRGNDDV